MIFKFAGFAVKLLGIRRRVTLERDIGPIFCHIRIDLQPFVETRLSISLDGLSRTFRLADPAVNAFIGMDHQHVLAFIKAINRANFHAIHILALDAIFDDDIGHSALRTCCHWLRFKDEAFIGQCKHRLANAFAPVAQAFGQVSGARIRSNSRRSFLVGRPDPASRSGKTGIAGSRAVGWGVKSR